MEMMSLSVESEPLEPETRKTMGKDQRQEYHECLTWGMSCFIIFVIGALVGSFVVYVNNFEVQSHRVERHLSHLDHDLSDYAMARIQDRASAAMREQEAELANCTEDDDAMYHYGSNSTGNHSDETETIDDDDDHSGEEIDHTGHEHHDDWRIPEDPGHVHSSDPYGNLDDFEKTYRRAKEKAFTLTAMNKKWHDVRDAYRSFVQVLDGDVDTTFDSVVVREEVWYHQSEVEYIAFHDALDKFKRRFYNVQQDTRNAVEIVAIAATVIAILFCIACQRLWRRALAWSRWCARLAVEAQDAVVDNLGVPALIVDGDSLIILSANACACETFGYKVDSDRGPGTNASSRGDTAPESRWDLVHKYATTASWHLKSKILDATSRRRRQRRRSSASSCCSTTSSTTNGEAGSSPRIAASSPPPSPSLRMAPTPPPEDTTAVLQKKEDSEESSPTSTPPASELIGSTLASCLELQEDEKEPNLLCFLRSGLGSPCCSKAEKTREVRRGSSDDNINTSDETAPSRTKKPVAPIRTTAEDWTLTQGDVADRSTYFFGPQRIAGRTRTGEPLDLIVHATRTVDPLSEKRFRYTIVCQDVTALVSKDLELDIQRKVIAQLAHELRNKTTAAASMLEQIQHIVVDEACDARAELLKLDDDITSSVALLAEADQLIKTRLAIHRVHRGDYVSVVETVDLKEAMTARCRSAAAVAAKTVNFRVELPGEYEETDDDVQGRNAKELYVRLDTYMFCHLANNFLSNARKAVDKGEVVFAFLGCEPAAEPPKSTMSSASNDETSSISGGDNMVVKFSVRDTGRGIPKSTADRLFREEVANGDERGVGLGLVSCRKFAEAVGGRCWLEETTQVTAETPVGGSDFRFELPGRVLQWHERCRARAKTSPATKWTSRSQASGKKSTTPRKGSSSDAAHFASAAAAFPAPGSTGSTTRCPSSDDDLNSGVVGLDRSLSADKHQLVGASTVSPSKAMRRSNSGTCFFPDHPDTAPIRIPKHLKVYIVEDSGLIRKSIKAKLEKVRTRVDGAVFEYMEFSTCEALLQSLDDLLETGPNALVTVDQNLASAGGNLLGSDLIKNLAGRGFDGMMVSISGDIESDILHLACGANLTLGKPLPPVDTIFETLNAAYNKRRLSSSFGDSDDVSAATT